MRFQRLSATGDPLFAAVWRLYLDSFPGQERRHRRVQRRVMLHQEAYHAEAVLTDDGRVAGLLFWWDLEGSPRLRYIEHLATFPALRGQGIGAAVLADFLARDPQVPVLLEVEPLQTGNWAARRIEFYRRAGFSLSPVVYTHPSYHVLGDDVPLSIMSAPFLLTPEQIEGFRTHHHPLIFSHSHPLPARREHDLPSAQMCR